MVVWCGAVVQWGGAERSSVVWCGGCDVPCPGKLIALGSCAVARPLPLRVPTCLSVLSLLVPTYLCLSYLYLSLLVPTYLISTCPYVS